MDWAALREELAAKYADNPQKAMKADLALLAAEAAIDLLASMGHRFDLVPAVPASLEEWPKMIYHDREGQRVIAKPEDMPAEPGWREHPTAVMVMEEVKPSKPAKLGKADID